MNEDHDFHRLYVTGLGTPDEVTRQLLATGHYEADGLDLTADRVIVDVRRNKSGTVLAGEPAWLAWPVTVEIFRDEDDPAPDADMIRVATLVTTDLRTLGAEVVGDFE